jgi:fumarate hydratase class II
MAKNTTNKIKELKTEKPSKITNEELNQVQSVINDVNRAQLEIGSFESKKHNLLHHVAQLQEKLGEMQANFEKIYGTADINIQDGTINHQKENVKTD